MTEPGCTAGRSIFQAFSCVLRDSFPGTLSVFQKASCSLLFFVNSRATSRSRCGSQTAPPSLPLQAASTPHKSYPRSIAACWRVFSYSSPPCPAAPVRAASARNASLPDAAPWLQSRSACRISPFSYERIAASFSHRLIVYPHAPHKACSASLALRPAGSSAAKATFVTRLQPPPYPPSRSSATNQSTTLRGIFLH